MTLLTLLVTKVLPYYKFLIFVVFDGRMGYTICEGLSFSPANFMPVGEAAMRA